MVPETKKFELEIGGKTVTVETGKYAQSANGSVTVRCGDTMLFVHCCVSKEPRVGIDFFPLLIDYEERMSSIGRIPGVTTVQKVRQVTRLSWFQDLLIDQSDRFSLKDTEMIYKS